MIPYPEDYIKFQDLTLDYLAIQRKDNKEWMIFNKKTGHILFALSFKDCPKFVEDHFEVDGRKIDQFGNIIL